MERFSTKQSRLELYTRPADNIRVIFQMHCEDNSNEYMGLFRVIAFVPYKRHTEFIHSLEHIPDVTLLFTHSNGFHLTSRDAPHPPLYGPMKDVAEQLRILVNQQRVATIQICHV